MIHGLLNTIYGTLFTWGLTALGAACVLVVPPNSTGVLDISLGFSGGVMLAASYWSLLNPALSLAEEQGWGKASFLPVSLGIVLGAGFVWLADVMLPDNVVSDILTMKTDPKPKTSENVVTTLMASNLRHRKPPKDQPETKDQQLAADSPKSKQIRRLILLVIAITVHNFPEGLAVGVGYASVGRPGVTIQHAHNLALGIGLQNFPEGLAVSVPLRAAGYSTQSSFFWGQASGMVEPIAGIIGVLCVTMVEHILSVALSFAAGAMIWVVCNDIIPESAERNGTKVCSLGIIVGFVLMMSLDTSLA